MCINIKSHVRIMCMMYNVYDVHDILIFIKTVTFNQDLLFPSVIVRAVSSPISSLTDRPPITYTIRESLWRNVLNSVGMMLRVTQVYTRTCKID